MKKTIVLFVMATLCLFLRGSAQPINTVIKPVQIGQKVPEINLTHLHNYKTDKINLADFEAKLIIIDFWATWCTACLANFPKLEKLQQEYAGTVQFISVTDQKQADVLPFLEKFRKGQPSLIPEVTDDQVLSKLFPHRTLPHYVWIDQGGTVIATTAAEQVTSKNIDSILNNGTANFKLKIDLDRTKPLFIRSDLLKDNELKHYAVLFKGAYDGLPSGTVPQKNNLHQQTGVISSNMPLIQLYDYVVSNIFLQQGEHYSVNRRFVTVKDTAKVFNSTGLSFGELFTYACNSPDLRGISLFKSMLHDLNQYTDYTGEIKKQKMKCYVLKRTGDIRPLNGRTRPIDRLIIQLISLPYIHDPVVDETEYKDIDISISKIQDLVSLKKVLKSKGLKLIEAERSVSVFVLTDKVSTHVSTQANSPVSNNNLNP